MKNVIKLASKLQKLDSDQLESVRNWLDALEGPNRKEALGLIERLMSGEIKEEEALKVLDRIKDSGC